MYIKDELELMIKYLGKRKYCPNYRYNLIDYPDIPIRRAVSEAEYLYIKKLRISGLPKYGSFLEEIKENGYLSDNSGIIDHDTPRVRWRENSNGRKSGSNRLWIL